MTRDIKVGKNIAVEKRTRFVFCIILTGVMLFFSSPIKEAVIEAIRLCAYNVIPTFANRRGVDFYINGEPFDQKVSRSVGRNFIAEYGEDYREIAISRPDLVAKCLYEYQDEARFGCEPRLLVVYLDSDLEIEDIEDSLAEVDFDNPININFEYRHSDGRTLIYETYCYIVLLHR